MRRLSFALMIVSGVLTFGGCATVSPWDRELLADPAMQVDPNPIQTAYDDHIYFSTESSSGGRSFGGGGCGCN